MEKISVHYLRRLGACWSVSKLQEASQSWPSANPSWAWFLGDRLAALSRAEVVLRVHCATAHVVLQRIRMPVAPGEISAICKACNDEQLAVVLGAFGALLDLEADAPDYAAAFDTFQTALENAKAGAP